MDIETLYQKYGPMVVRRCRQLLQDEDQALDVSQDVFVHNQRERGRLDLASPASLLYRIATNLCLNRLRHRRRHPQTSDEKILFGIAGLDCTEERVAARSLLARLFDRHQESTRTIAVLHFLDGMTLEETAREVGMSVSGVRKRLRGLRATLMEIEAP
jgi:RNA polymerase sigma-70 factor (ECF subfamily)